MDTLLVNQHFSEKPNRQKVLRTIALLFAWLCMGMYAVIPGPTLIDLKLRLGANYEEISDAVAGQDIGYFIGALICGLLVDRFLAWCNLMAGVSLTLAALATACAPYAGTVRALWMCILIQGACISCMDVAGQKLGLMMWQAKSTGPMNILHSGFGIGAFIVPLIANPFLAVLKSDAVANATLNLVVNGSIRYSNDSLYEEDIARNAAGIGVEETEDADKAYVDTGTVTFVRESRIEIAYLITAGIVCVISVAFYVYQVNDYRGMRNCKSTRTEDEEPINLGKSKLKAMINPATCAGGDFYYGVAILSCLFMFYFNLVGAERIVGTFIRAYSIEQLGFSVDDGSYANTSFFISFAVGRFLGFFAARWVPIRVLLILDATGILLSTILLNIFSANNSLAFWILLQALGVFIGPCFPIGMGWANRHVDITGMAICLTLFGCSLGGMAYIRLTGYLFETFGPRTFLYHILGFGIATVVLSVILNLVGSRHGDRFDNDVSREVEGELEAMGKADQTK